MATDMREGKSANAYLSLNSTVLASTALTLFRNGRNCAISEAFLTSRMRSKLKTTSSGVTAEPSWKVAPSRSVAWYVVASIFVGILVESAGRATSVTGSRSTRPSKTCQLAATGVAPEEVIGSKPVDSAYEMPASIVVLSPDEAEVPFVEAGPPQAARVPVNAAAAPTAPAKRRKLRRSTLAGVF